MSQSLGGVIDPWKLPRTDEDRFKSWLEQQGWELCAESDDTMWKLTEQDLWEAGLQKRARIIVMAKLASKPEQRGIASPSTLTEALPLTQMNASCVCKSVLVHR